MPYHIQQRIHTLIQNAVMKDGNRSAFSLLGIEFSHWEFNFADGWTTNYWMAESSIEAPNFQEAWNNFSRNLVRLVPRITLIGQCYTRSVAEPFLIRRSGSNEAFFNFVQEVKGVPLMFAEEEVQALESLLSSGEVPEEFYLYWNEAVNTIGYSSKLVLMFAALEALFKRERLTSKDAYYAKIEAVLGADLKKKLYGTKEDSSFGLRQRLVHGEYLHHTDTEQNYVELIHRSVITYFNDVLLRKKLIEEGVVNPQRHLFGNLEQWQGFIRAQPGAKLNLKDVLADFAEHELSGAGKYYMLRPEERDKLFSSY